jgi:hypothetical protein
MAVGLAAHSFVAITSLLSFSRAFLRSAWRTQARTDLRDRGEELLRVLEELLDDAVGQAANIFARRNWLPTIGADATLFSGCRTTGFTNRNRHGAKPCEGESPLTR